MRKAFHVKIHRPHASRVHPAASSQASIRISSSGRLSNCMVPFVDLKTRTGNCQLRARSSAVAAPGRSNSSSRPSSRTPITRSTMASRPLELPDDNPSLVRSDVSYLLLISYSSPARGTGCGDSLHSPSASGAIATPVVMSTRRQVCRRHSRDMAMPRLRHRNSMSAKGRDQPPRPSRPRSGPRPQRGVAPPSSCHSALD